MNVAGVIVMTLRLALTAVAVFVWGSFLAMVARDWWAARARQRALRRFREGR